MEQRESIQLTWIKVVPHGARRSPGVQERPDPEGVEKISAFRGDPMDDEMKLHLSASELTAYGKRRAGRREERMLTGNWRDWQSLKKMPRRACCCLSQRAMQSRLRPSQIRENSRLSPIRESNEILANCPRLQHGPRLQTGTVENDNEKTACSASCSASVTYRKNTIGGVKDEAREQRLRRPGERRGARVVVTLSKMKKPRSELCTAWM